jgi:hypothetical protein
MSINEAIANLIEQLPDPNEPLVLSPWTQTLVNIYTQNLSVNEEKLQQEYLDYLEEKYQ